MRPRNNNLNDKCLDSSTSSSILITETTLKPNPTLQSKCLSIKDNELARWMCVASYVGICSYMATVASSSYIIMLLSSDNCRAAAVATARL